MFLSQFVQLHRVSVGSSRRQCKMNATSSRDTLLTPDMTPYSQLLLGGACDKLFEGCVVLTISVSGVSCPRVVSSGSRT